MRSPYPSTRPRAHHTRVATAALASALGRLSPPSISMIAARSSNSMSASAGQSSCAEVAAPPRFAEAPPDLAKALLTWASPIALATGTFDGLVSTMRIYELSRRWTLRGRAGEQSAVDLIYRLSFD